MQIKKKIQLFYTGISSKGQVWYDSGSSIEVVDSELFPLKWITSQYNGPDVCLITVSVISEEQVILVDQKSYELVKSETKILGVIPKSFDFSDECHDFIHTFESNADLFEIKSYYHHDALLLLIDAALASGNKDLFMSLTRELNARN